MAQHGLRWRLPKRWRPYAALTLCNYMDQNSIRVPELARTADVSEECVRWHMNCARTSYEIRYLMYWTKIIKQNRDNSLQPKHNFS